MPDQARDTDAQEGERFGESFRGDGLPEELRRRGDRLAAIEAAKEHLEAAQREADGKAQGNFTDPDGAMMRTGSEGFRQCRNAQVAVDGKYRLIVATGVTSNANNRGAPEEPPDEVRNRFDAQPGTVPAAAGYCNGRDLSEPEVRGIDGYVWRSVS